MLSRGTALANVERLELGALHEGIAALARAASIEMTWRDVGELEACRSLLAPGTLVFASFLPEQTWRQTIETCAAIRDAGFEPVPHIPVRHLDAVAAFEQLAEDLYVKAQVQRVLLIAGDLPETVGPFSTTLDALHSGALAARGIHRIVVAGHPEGHPKLTREELREVEQDKVAFAESHGFELTFLTQFLFDAAPFLAWARELRAEEGVRSRLVVGLAGPARLATLVKYAVRCGVGPSIRVLTANPTSFVKLVGDRGPEKIVRAVAAAGVAGEIDNFGIHFYSFGGLARTCAWMSAVAEGRFALDEEGGFEVQGG
jgi:methylenetetrahydrofolate reductase (NADH)